MRAKGNLQLREKSVDADIKEERLICKEELLRGAEPEHSLRRLNDLSLPTTCISLPCHLSLHEIPVIPGSSFLLLPV